jgi:hypothetical protein
MHVAFISVSFRSGQFDCDTTKAWVQKTIKAIVNSQCMSLAERRARISTLVGDFSKYGVGDIKVVREYANRG